MTDNQNIYKAVTKYIIISVVPRYEAAESNPAIGKFVFSYHITVENSGKHRVKLISRNWYIVDSIQSRRQISGEGVVGQQPELHPGDSFSYMSWCPLQSAIGKMFGSYTFYNFDENEHFDVKIPEFKLIADFKLN